MNRPRFSIVPLALVIAQFSPLAPARPLTPFANQQEKQQPAKNPPAAAVASMTGCVDEQEGKYILVGGPELQPMANLQADGFPVEGFAKHVGHKVTVRGTSIPGSSLPTFKVRRIETVSDSCTVQPEYR